MKILPSLALVVGLAGSSATAANYLTNGNTGFGGVLSSLDITDDGTNVTFVLNRGAGNLNDRFVLYIDSVAAAGFSSTSGFTDNADLLRAAISGTGFTSGASVVNFGFDADRALALDGGFAGLWSLANGGSHTFITTANGSPGGGSQPNYSMTVAIADLGISPGDSIDFVATYLNADNAFRSDEAIGDGIPSGNPGNTTVTFTGSRSYTTIPEPSVALLGGIGLLGLLRRRGA